ncbi:hypothetical protein RHOSPDRAFT_36444 [Rhodotorula sp. JG-1b]|nr:hypothetical protein RHOSPDRAFT_36444 [Rhodotorula sp. JG-1b]
MAPPKSAVAQKLLQDDPTLLPSEDEDDSDFHLSDNGRNSDDSSDSDSDSDSGAKRKRKRSPPAAVSAPEPAIDKATVDDLWAQFNNPLEDPYAHPATTATTSSAPKQAADTDLVTIEVEQEKRVARTSAEAQAYFARPPPPDAAVSATSAPPPPTAAAPAPSTAAKPTDPTTASLDALFGPESEPSTSTATSTSGSAGPAGSNPPKPKPEAAPLPAAKRRKTGKGGGGLAGMAAAMGVGGKPAKLNTLEKSKLDWTLYVSSETGLEDSLAHARKDGYLDRRDFLDRVEGKKSEQFDQARQASRRGPGAAAKR